MESPGELWRRLLFLFRRRAFDRDLEEEMQFHLDRKALRNRERGMGAKDAHYAARRQFGNATLLKEAGTEAYGWRWLEEFVRDVRFAFRMLRRNLAFTLLTVLTLALGIGVNTSIFGFVDRLLLRSLPVRQSDRLVTLARRGASPDSVYTSFSYPEYAYYRDHNDVLTGLAVYAGGEAAVEFGGEPERLTGEIVSGNYFTLLGVQLAMGRPFLPEEDQALDASPVVILSHGTWKRRFGGDPSVLGRQITMNRRPFTVVGVAPPGFLGLRADRASAPEFWAPFVMFPTLAAWAAEGPDLRYNWGNQSLNCFGRLKPEVSLEQASPVFARLGSELQRSMSKGVIDREAPVLIPTNDMRLAPRYRGTVARLLGLLWAAAGTVWLIACLNVANLLLARASVRGREMAARLAVGAGRVRLFRQLATESLVLSLLGGAGGLLVFLLTSKALVSFGPFQIPVLLETSLDFRIAAFTLLLASLTGLLLGMIPMRQAIAADLVGALKADHGTGARLRRLGPLNILLVAQAALSVVLVVSAGLFVRTLINARATDVTVRPESVLTTALSPAARRYSESRGQAFYAQLLERIRGLPGVQSAALVMVVPMGGRRGGTNVSITVPENPSEKRSLQVDFNVISPQYFETVGIPLVRGRSFTSHDRDGAPPVVIVNERWAERFWPGQDALGKRFETGRPERTVEVVGVVRDGKFRNYRAGINPCFYVPLAQDYSGSMDLELRVAGAPLALAPALRREILALDRDFPFSAALTLAMHREAGLGSERMAAGLLSCFGLLALVLAAIGIYGIISCSVSRRTREIGIRMALGARAGEVLRMVLAQGMALTLTGLVLGLAAAVAVMRLLASLLYGVSPTDPGTLAGAALVLLTTALAACYVPARRATKINPVGALRHE